MPHIHPSALVSKDCEMADDVVIGPSCVISGRVSLGAGVKLMGGNHLAGHVGPVSVGAGTVLWPNAHVGFEPQDYKFSGGTAGVTIGAGCYLREGATVHASTKSDRPTRLGDKVFMMVNTHVAHDCAVGDRVVMVNGSCLAGHCEVASDVTLGGNAVVHQFCRIGRLVMMSGDCAISKDVPPFCTVSERNRVGMLNVVGLRRNGLRDHVATLNEAFKRYLYRPMPRKAVVEGLREMALGCAPVGEMADFVEKSTRGIVTGFGKPARGAVRAGRAGAEELALAEE